MEDKIETNEYVRTYDGDIFKFGGYFKNKDIDSMTDEHGLLYGNQKKCCKKHRKNIADLIEIGDILEISLSKIHDSTKLLRIKDEEQLEIIKEMNIEYIKSIICKEQFESIKYEIPKE